MANKKNSGMGTSDDVIQILQEIVLATKSSSEANIQQLMISQGIQKAAHDHLSHVVQEMAKSQKSTIDNLATNVDRLVTSVSDLTHKNKQSGEKINEIKVQIGNKFEKIDTHIEHLGAQIHDLRLNEVTVRATKKTERQNKDDFHKYWLPLLKTVVVCAFAVGGYFAILEVKMNPPPQAKQPVIVNNKGKSE